MVLLQPKLNLKITQKQILTPGLVQMVSVLALNKLELKDMINAEMVENPVLEEWDPAVPLLDEVESKEEERERQATPEEQKASPEEKKDPFDEVDMDAYFKEYLDPGYRSNAEWEDIEKPSFENFLSKPATLTDHLEWQLGAESLRDEVRAAAEMIIGNLNEEGYLIATDEELLAAAGWDIEVREEATEPDTRLDLAEEPNAEDAEPAEKSVETTSELEEAASIVTLGSGLAEAPAVAVEEAPEAPLPAHRDNVVEIGAHKPLFDRKDLHEALAIVRQFDPVGVGSRNLQECLIAQMEYQQHLHREHKINGENTPQLLSDAISIIANHLRALQLKQYREIAKAMGRPPEAVTAAIEYIRTLDPKPGLRYNKQETKLIEPDVAFVKQGDEYVVVMNDEDLPQLRLSPTYKRLLNRENAEKDVRNYVKERYKSAIQLIKNIEQRKQTILKVCYAIIRRQQEFLDQGIDQLKPMMIKEVAEEIGVHPSTVSRAVANKYAHTPQGVFELRYFFSESVQGPEGGNTSLLILKRRVKKLIEEEDPTRPLTDEQITRILQSQGIQVTRRTVAKYREDMRIPSTHQRRVKT
jgi:RNA polymerase sigma-54 factor